MKLFNIYIIWHIACIEFVDIDIDIDWDFYYDFDNLIFLIIYANLITIYILLYI